MSEELESEVLHGDMVEWFCGECDGHHFGWEWREKVGPNLSQRAVRFQCANCQTVYSLGVVYT